MDLPERTVTCPSCWEEILLVIDPSAGGQTYIEDCSVCCRPLQVSYEVHDGELSGLQVESAN